MEFNYENAMKRLDEIVKTMDEGGLSLEKSLELYTEGTKLIAKCGKYLEESEQKIKILLDNGDVDEQ